MTIVRCILVEMTLPVRIRPRIETMPVNGHFLSVYHVSAFALALLFPPELSLLCSSFCGRHTDVGTLNGGLWRSEAQTNIFEPSSTSLAALALRRLGLVVEEDMRLLLESALGLDSQLGGHACDCVTRTAWNGCNRSCREVATNVFANRGAHNRFLGREYLG